MREATFTFHERSTKENGSSFVVSGRLSEEEAAGFLSAFQSSLPPQGTAVRLDMAGVTYLDSAGVAALLEVELELNGRNGTLALENVPATFRGMLGLIDRSTLNRQPVGGERRNPNAISRLGAAVIHVVGDLLFQVGFVGELALSAVRALKNPRAVRWGNTVLVVQRMGVDALFIICLINFLVGLTIGFQSAISLRQYGANIFLADLVGLGMVRELGPLMTAILVAGRSGSAFAAEIGTMKVSEEVDALVTMGFDPFGFLVIPRMLAGVIVVPLLTLFADLMGIAGGLIVGVTSLDLTVATYIQETYKALSITHVFSGIFKSVLFGLTIAFVGCLRGFQVQGGAESVGQRTTSSVVTSIFLIIVIDAFFGIFFRMVGI